MEPLAIVGLSLKFPQDASSPEAFWEMLMRKKSAMTVIPDDRFNVDAHYHPDKNRTSMVSISWNMGAPCLETNADFRQLNVRGGHFIKEDLACFDAPFFSITPAEAECMDPQHRWALETTYRALENGMSTSEHRRQKR